MKDETLLSDEVIESLEMLTSRNYFREWIKNPTGYVAGSIAVRDLVNVVLFADACRAAMLNHPEQHLDMVDHSGDVNEKVAPPLQSGNSGQPVTVPAGYVLVPVELLSDLRDFANPEIEKYCEMWDCRMDEEFPAMRKIISDADALLSAAPQSPGSQLTTAPGWTGNGNANAALVILDRIDTLDPADDDRIEEVKQIVRSLAEPKAPDGWIPVSERMPPCKTGVLVATEMDGPGDWRMKWATYVPKHPDAINGWLIPGASWTPTHWQPLPDAPKGV